jgi:hypothetical protein
MRFSLKSWWSDDAAAPAGGAVDHVGQFVDYVVNLLVEAAAVGALHDQVVRARHSLGIADDGQVGAADVAGVGEAERRAPHCAVQHDAGGSENMSGVPGLVAQGVGQSAGLVVGHGAEEREGAFGIGCSVERHHREGVFAARVAGGFALLGAFVEEFGVLFLNVGGVAQHPVAQIDTGRGGEDGSGETVLDQGGQAAAVIDVGVGKHHSVNGGSGKGEGAVLQVGVLAAALVEPAVQQIPFAVAFQQVHGTGDGAGRAPECELHQRHGSSPKPASRGSLQRGGAENAEEAQRKPKEGKRRQRRARREPEQTSKATRLRIEIMRA